MQHVRIEDAEFEWLERGQGEPVVLVHGAPSDCRLWLPHCEMLAARYRAIAYTQRYFGSGEWQSGWPPFGVRTHVDDLVAVLEHLGEPAHVVAWSYGAHVALVAASEAPRLFRSVFLYEPGVPTYVEDPDELAAFSADAQSMFGPVFVAVQRGDVEGGVRVLLDGSGASSGYFDSQPPERRRVQLDNARVLPLLLAQPPSPPLTCRDLQRLQVPSVVAWGERTRPLFGIVSRAAARCLPGGAHVIVPGATHMWPEERPRDMAALVERIIARSP